MKTINLKLTGIKNSPLCFHNERLANPFDTYTKQLKQLSSQKKKTEEILLQMQKLEWRAGFYEVDGCPGITSDMVLASGLGGAKKTKRGPAFNAGVIADECVFPLIHDGPKKIDELWNVVDGDGRQVYLDYRSVQVNRNRVMRARPRFDSWSCVIELQHDPDLVGAEELFEMYAQAGLVVGLGERRPRWGRYSVELV